MKKNKYFLIIFSILFCSLFMSNMVYAAGIEWWEKATSWYSSGSTTIGISADLLEGIANVVEIFGTGIILISTVIIGFKYMLGTVQGKADAKENLVTLVIACLLFFGWTNIRDVLIVGNSIASNGVSGSTQLIFFQNGDIKGMMSQLFTFIVFVAKFISVFAIMYLGVKYVYAGSGAKAKIKEQAPALIIGVIFIFCAVNIVGFIAGSIASI